MGNRTSILNNFCVNDNLNFCMDLNCDLNMEITAEDDTEMVPVSEPYIAALPSIKSSKVYEKMVHKVYCVHKAAITTSN